jgi:hypothetical protein
MVPERRRSGRADGPDAGAHINASIVDLRIEAVEAQIRLARLIGGRLASHAGMTVEEMDDLRLAIDEACSALITGGARVRWTSASSSADARSPCGSAAT